MHENREIALALSGGGIRAMAFHSGVLLYLAEKNYLEKVCSISSVSGGSLLIGMVYAENNCVWPTSKRYQDCIHSNIKNRLCTSNLQLRSALALLKPINWSNILSRANVLAKTIEELWGINSSMGGIADYPAWSINGTTAENGKRFRFKNDTFGDYHIGYSSSNEFKISKAIAISAAFPGGIGPLSINTDEYTWKKRKRWDDPPGTEKIVNSPYKKLHIYDGGVYDNLGTEPIFDSGKGSPKISGTSILVSDAGSPFQNRFSSWPLNPFRLKHILDICMDQSRSLRVRSFMNYLKQDKKNGAYLMIGQHPQEILGDNEISDGNWQSEDDVKQAASYKTDLLKISPSNFDRIARHGYELAKSLDIVKHGFI